MAPKKKGGKKKAGGKKKSVVSSLTKIVQDQQVIQMENANAFKCLSGSSAHAEKTIKSFRARAAGFEKIYKNMRSQGNYAHAVLGQLCTDSKPPTPAWQADESQMVPVAVVSLQVGVTQKGKYILGKVVERTHWTGQSVAALIKDPLGGVVEIAVYNIPYCDMQVAARIFPEGRVISIREPHFKIRGDNTPGVRIDNVLMTLEILLSPPVR